MNEDVPNNIVFFSQFGPDRSVFDPSYTDVVTNVLPLDNSFGPFPSFKAYSEPVPDRPQGAFLAVHGNGNWLPIVGTNNKLYKLDFDTKDWTDISAANTSYSTPGTTRWSFCQFGDMVIATNGVDNPQYYDINNVSGTFATLPNAPRARNADTLGDFVFFSYLPDISDRAVQWSGLNDPFEWTPTINSSDFNTFPDDGEIMATSSFEKGIVIFHEHCIREGVLNLDSNMVMNFQKTLENHGTHARNSVVATGAGTFYLSQDGFYKYSTPTPTKIGVERVDRFFFEKCSNDETFYIWGSEDPERKIIYWLFRSKENDTPQTFDYIFVYNYGVDRWSVIKPGFKITQMVDAVTVGPTLDGMNEYGGLEEIPFPLDSRAWSGSLPTIAAFDEQYRLGFFSGPPMEAVIQTNDIKLNPDRRSFVKGFTPLSDAENTSGRVATKDFPGKPRVWNNSEDSNQFTGEIPTRATGQFHRFEVTIPAGTTWKTIHGVDVDYVPEGKR